MHGNIPRNQPCPHCGRYANRGIGVDTLIVKDNKILLIKRGGEPFKDHWALPGGYLDWDEDLAQAVVREVREELGVDGTIVRLLGIYSQPERHPQQALVAAFVVNIEGRPTPGDDAADCAWFELNELPGGLAFDHSQIIEDFKADKSAIY